ncbi:MDR/zinc-dependent alcohol dehydrogenase-like family protein [Microlunatus flavus]|uniref:D-arabinose 1-dehydrogenase, Zn-dependent alcohol dehydrogenase family n=1 Tax=Microlunatus flavus TaxID=1036181 RepID=A0A1H9H0M8_9ACTN|nr:medium chain dehydrogenase/reductase family protein [Microlunatus flavus]SEQ55905.1 D-arabinose 1-dehydrogenase, Zn-dependent alcohol dehydrogenase family [Microlunatus flavus]
MKAWTLTSLDAGLTLEEVPDPQPRSGGAVLRMLAVQVPAYTRVLVAGGRGGIATPTVLGVGGIGVVEAVGDDVHAVRPGDVVMSSGFLSSGRVAEPEEVLLGWTGIGGRGTATGTTDAMRRTWRTGTFAERALMPASTLIALPGAEDHPDLARLAFLPWLTIAAGAVERGDLAAGDSVVVAGATGQLGGATVLLALAAGAGRVVAFGRNRASLERLAALDDRVVPVAALADRAADAAALARALGGDADVVVDALGPAPTSDLTMAAYDVLRTDGTMVLVGGVRQSLPIPYSDLMHRRLTLRGSWMASNETAYATWRQVRAGLVDLDALQVTTVGLNDPDQALAQAEAVRGLEIVTLRP